MDFLRSILGFPSGDPTSTQQPVEQRAVSQVGEGHRHDSQVQYGYAALQGRRGGMEDYVSANFKECQDGQEYGFFGVFDGHGGPAAARFVRDSLFATLEAHAHFPDDMQTALKESFEKTDETFLSISLDQGHDDGSTGVVAVVVGRTLWIAHVGDSRAVLCRANGAEALSEDHKPSHNAEHARIEAAGGAVIWAGTWRVSGVLAVSRAFGDRPLKKYVIATPDVSSHTLEDAVETFVILASDGLWDVCTNWEAGEIVRKHLAEQHQQPPHLKSAARALADAAIQRGSADNVSCIVIRLAPHFA